MPITTAPVTQRQRFTFKGNTRSSRHGWLRLTPAYSVHLVRELSEAIKGSGRPVLDPFSGTGTTLVACAELGVACDGVELNPFLVWLTRAKSTRYDAADVERGRALVERMARAAGRARTPGWTPSLHRIDKWWTPNALAGLSRAFAELGHDARGAQLRAQDLARVAFCRALIDTANVSFGHQSMSFKKTAATQPTARDVAESLFSAYEAIAAGARAPLGRAPRKVLLGDARCLHQALEAKRYGAVITSPPYPNRMSYIRELRPYMYWLGYLRDGKDAGELDWKIIGGTWGAATSRLLRWEPARAAKPPPGVDPIALAIAGHSPLLAQYVRKYFEDMAAHVQSVTRVLGSGARLHYVIGNSKFYDVMLPAEQLLGQLFERYKLRDVEVRVLRKRTSKRELFEYLVSAVKR